MVGGLRGRVERWRGERRVLIVVQCMEYVGNCTVRNESMSRTLKIVTLLQRSRVLVDIDSRYASSLSKAFGAISFINIDLFPIER